MIEAHGLTKRYDGATVVSGLSFTIRPGQVTSFLGPNGAGKSTTMRMILGLDFPSAGTVTVNGKRYASYTMPMHEVGALLDAGAVHGGRTARNHLLCLAKTNGIGAKRVDEVLGMVGLAKVAGKRPKTFSLGMRQRFGIAAALLGDLGVLMFDAHRRAVRRGLRATRLWHRSPQPEHHRRAVHLLRLPHAVAPAREGAADRA
jgi:ABC-2 type transport system ATP-binding protein